MPLLHRHGQWSDLHLGPLRAWWGNEPAFRHFTRLRLGTLGFEVCIRGRYIGACRIHKDY